MRSQQQQFFLLLILFLATTSSSIQSARSHDGSDRLIGSREGSRLTQADLDRVVISENSGRHGAGLLGKQSSTVLELEDAERDNTDDDGPSSESHGVAETSPAPASDTPPVPPERIERTTPQNNDQYVTPQSVETSGDGTPVEIRPSEEIKPAVEERTILTETKAKKVKKAAKKKSKKSRVKEELTESLPPVAPPIAKPQEATTSPKTSEETLLSSLVKELEFGTLPNSIKLLNQLVERCPEDPDYRSLLSMAIRLRDGDVWYSYKRKVETGTQDREPPKPAAPQQVQLLKPTDNESVNDLKKSSWFLMRHK